MLHLCRAKSPAAAKALIACAEDETAPWPSRIAAATAILDRAWGKPKEHAQLDAAEGGITVLEVSPFKAKLFPEQASQAITAAIECATEHLETAELLEHQRYAHCVSASILSMEEGGKMPIIMRIFLFGESAESWREYSSHPAKTRPVNYGISLRIKAEFPDLPPGFAESIGAAGPPPAVLEKTKQHAVYSDCLAVKGKCYIHKPNAVDRKEIAWNVLSDARVFVRALRTKSAAELTIWLDHAKKCQKAGRTFDTELPALERSLREGGFIKEGRWNNIRAEGGQTSLP